MNEENRHMPTQVFGQWIGYFEGSCPIPGNPSLVFPGSATLNIERDRPETAFACIDQGNEIHGSRKDFSIKFAGGRLSGKTTTTSAFDFQTNEVISIEESTKRQALLGRQISYLTDIEIFNGILDNQLLNCEWSGHHQGNKVTGTFKGQKLTQNESSPADKTMVWDEFKVFVAETIKAGQEFLFRGQASTEHRLNTSFHREGRYDLLRYERDECAQLVRHINSASLRQYDLKSSVDFGSLLSLAQHHGFPTPLLDWSRSPYIAAYFAFENRSSISNGSDFSRIYVFNALGWQQDTTQSWHIADPRPVITPIEFAAHNNPRHLPQQSVHTFTNIADPEAWIRIIEKTKKRSYLTTIDIPRSQRRLAMRDLAYMGVTAATLFPGLEGVCRSLKERFFTLN